MMNRRWVTGLAVCEAICSSAIREGNPQDCTHVIYLIIREVFAHRLQVELANFFFQYH